MRALRWMTLPMIAALALYACSNDDDDGGTNVEPDAGTADAGPKDAGGTPVTDAGSDAATPVTDSGGEDAGDASQEIPIRCTQAEFDQAASVPNGGDYTGQLSVEISFPTDAQPAQYTNRCIKVKFGTEVTFKGNFGAHPLEPAGGNTPTPIPTTPDVPNGILTVKMTNTGTFGFQCQVHPSMMFGAIQVVE